MLIDIVQFGNLFNCKSFLIVLKLKLCFCKLRHHMKGHKTCVGMFNLHTSFIKDDRSRQRHLTDRFDDWVGHLNTILARGGGN